MPFGFLEKLRRPTPEYLGQRNYIHDCNFHEQRANSLSPKIPEIENLLEQDGYEMQHQDEAMVCFRFLTSLPAISLTHFQQISALTSRTHRSRSTVSCGHYELISLISLEAQDSHSRLDSKAPRLDTRSASSGSRSISSGPHELHRPTSSRSGTGSYSVSSGPYRSRSGSALNEDSNLHHPHSLSIFHDNSKLIKQLLLRVDHLERELSDLRENVELKDNLRAETLPSSTDTFLRKDYPHVKFWTKYDWKDSKVKGSAYLEDENGNPISTDEANRIRKHAKRIWQEFLNVGVAPATWMKIDASANHQYQQQMEKDFPLLRLCEGHWKVERLAIDNYPSWRSHAVNASGESLAEGVGNKRIPQSLTGPAAKKRKSNLPSSSMESSSASVNQGVPQEQPAPASSTIGMTIPMATVPMLTRETPIPVEAPPSQEPSQRSSFSFVVSLHPPY